MTIANRALKWTAGRLILSFIAVFTAISPYLAHWNATHIFNPHWLPHARFHNAQAMVLGAYLGLLSLYCLWSRKGGNALHRVYEAATLASLYWLAQLLAILFPGTKLFNTNGIKMPTVAGVQLNQLTLDLIFILPSTIIAVYLERKKTKAWG